MDWEKGPGWIAEKIEEIRQRYDGGKDDQPPRTETEKPPELSDAEKRCIAQRVQFNRDGLALSIGGVLEQVAEFREKARGLNGLDPDYREDLLAFLDQLSNQLNEMLRQIPAQDEEISDQKASNLAQWWQEFQPLLSEKSREYISPKNVTEAAVPSGIIVSCMGVGALVGGPPGAGVGALVGGLIAGHVKPNKVLDELMKQQESPQDDG